MQNEELDLEEPRPTPWWKRLAIGVAGVAAGAVAFIALGQGYALIGGT